MSIKMKMTMCLAAAVFAVPLVNNATNQGEAAKKMPIPLGFTVVDSAGKTVGPVIGNIGGGAFGSPDSTDFTSVAIGFNGKWLPIQVSRTQLGQPSLDFLDFETPDCSGQPFAPLLGFSPFPETTVAPPGATLYFESGPTESIMVGSSLISGSCIPSSPPTPASEVPMTPAFDLTVFTPPFSVVPSRMKDLP